MADLVRSAVLTNYVAIAQSVGLDPYAMAKAVGLSPVVLSETDMKISAAAVRQLLEDSANASGAENFGLRMAENRKLSTMGLVGMVTRDAATVRHALVIMTRFMRSHNETLFLEIEETGAYATIRDEMILRGAQLGSMRQAIELSIGALVRIIRVLLGDDWVPERVYFSHPAPKDLSLHRRLFGLWPEFGHEFNGLVCHQRDLDRPIASSDPVMARYAQAQLEQALDPTHYSTAREVRQMAMILLPNGRCTIEQIARQLSVDRRTIHRQLAREGTSYTAEINALRRELSDRHLANSKRALSEISYLLGFSGPAAYAKWHNQQFGHTASQRRQNLTSS
jgi:AraC-like DNA-binding protein